MKDFLLERCGKNEAPHPHRIVVDEDPNIKDSKLIQVILERNRKTRLELLYGKPRSAPKLRDLTIEAVCSPFRVHGPKEGSEGRSSSLKVRKRVTPVTGVTSAEDVPLVGRSRVWTSHGHSGRIRPRHARRSLFRRLFSWRPPRERRRPQWVWPLSWAFSHAWCETPRRSLMRCWSWVLEAMIGRVSHSDGSYTEKFKFSYCDS